jgi:hypothetical protein
MYENETVQRGVAEAGIMALSFPYILSRIIL